MPKPPSSRKRLRASSRDLSLRREDHSASASLSRAALTVRCAVDAVPHFWRERASKAGAVGADALLCRIGHELAAALRNVSESAEEARSQLRTQRASLHAAIDARYDTLEQGIANAMSLKTVALERELCTIDGVLESWRSGCSGMRETLTCLHDAELLKQQAMLNARLDDLESQLRALSTAPMEPPVVGIAADLSQLALAISCFGHIIAPRAITAIDLTLSEYPAYVIWGSPLVLRLTLGGAHADQTPEELEVSLGRLIETMRVEAAYTVTVGDAQAVDLETLLSFNVANRCIDITFPIPARPALSAGVIHVCKLNVNGQPVAGVPLAVSINCGLTSTELAAFDTTNPISIAAAMRADACSVNVAEWGCSLLANIGDFSGGVEYAAVLSTLVDVARMHMQSHCVVRNAFKVISVMAHDLSDGPRYASDAGAPAVIVAATRMHSGLADIVDWGFSALDNLLFENYAGKEAAVVAGAPASIVVALQAHARVASVSIRGCCTLGRIARNFLPGKMAAVAAGAPAAIVAAMQTHVKVALMSAEGCCALANIACECPAGQVAVVNAGASAAILAAMQAHAGDVDVSADGCIALCNIASTCPAGQKAAVDVGAPAVIVAAMRAHGGSTTVATRGCSLLALLASFPDGRLACVAAGGVDAVTVAMERHEAARLPGSAALQLFAK